MKQVLTKNTIHRMTSQTRWLSSLTTAIMALENSTATAPPQSSRIRGIGSAPSSSSPSRGTRLSVNRATAAAENNRLSSGASTRRNKGSDEAVQHSTVPVPSTPLSVPSPKQTGRQRVITEYFLYLRAHDAALPRPDIESLK